MFIFVFSVHVLLPKFVNCQTNAKVTQLKQLFKSEEKPNYMGYLKKSRNELQGTAALFFIAYKGFVSSQDLSSCVFSPTCSVYAIETLQSETPLKAYLKIFDRLTRCHPFSKKGEYSFYKKTNLLYDPVL